jgi:hypothetical protein
MTVPVIKWFPASISSPLRGEAYNEGVQTIQIFI